MNSSREQPPYLIQLSDWFIPTSLENDRESLRRVRLLLGFHGLGALNVFWTAIYQLSFGSTLVGLAALAFLPGIAAIPLMVKSGFSIRRLAAVDTTCFYAITLAITLLTDGRWPGGLYFLVLVPAVAVLLIDRRSGLQWSVVTIASIALVAWGSGLGFDIPKLALNDVEVALARYRIAGLLALAVFAMAYFYSSLNDRSVAALKETLEDVRRGEQRFRAIAEHAYDLIAELDETGSIIFASPGFEETLGWIPSEMEGHSFLERVHPDDLVRARGYWEELLEKSVVKQSPIRYESARVGCRWLELSMRCYESTEIGRRVVVVIRDATERLEREKLIRQQQNLVTVGTMATGVAHQLRNPISSILASAQYGNMFKWNPNFGDIAGESLDSIEEEAKNCGRVLSALLSFARQEPSARWIENLDLVARRAVSAVQGQNESTGATIEVVPCYDETPVLMGPIEIEQVLINMIRNALEAEATEVRIHVELGEDESVLVYIRDNGSGLTRDVQARAFDTCFTTHPESGSGLGLNIAREIVVDHGGELSLEHTSSEGTVFLVRLPLSTAEVETV